MAHSDIVYAGNAIGRMALVRAPIVSCDRSFVLVAGRSTFAQCVSPRSLDDLVPLFCDVALRHPLGISCFLRSRGLSNVLLVVTPLGIVGSSRSAVCGCVNVDMRHRRLFCGGGDFDYASSGATRSSAGRTGATEIARIRNWPNSFTEFGGSLSVASEPIVTAFDLPNVKRTCFWDATNWLDYLALTKPEVNFLIVVTTFAGFYLGCLSVGRDIPFLRSINAVLGTLLVASGTGALNQYIE